MTPKQSLTSNNETNEHVHKSTQLGGGSSIGLGGGIGGRSLPRNDLCIQGLAFIIDAWE